jgi:hypothetical protein
MKTYWAIKVEWKEGGCDWAWYDNIPCLGNIIIGDRRKDIIDFAIKWRNLSHIKSARPVKVTLTEVK